MRYLLLPVFILRLVVVLIPSFIKLGLYQFPPLGGLFISVLFLLFVLALTHPFFAPFLPFSVATTPTPPLQPALSPRVARIYQTTLKSWEELYQLQPNHRDVLLNIARLHQALGNANEYEKYWARAQQIDPNYSSFSN